MKAAEYKCCVLTCSTPARLWGPKKRRVPLCQEHADALRRMGPELFENQYTLRIRQVGSRRVAIPSTLVEASNIVAAASRRRESRQCRS